MRINKKYDMFYDPTSTFGAKAKKKTVNILIYILLITLSLIWVLPFVYLFIQSFTNNYNPGVIFPAKDTLTFQNYTNLFTSPNLPFWKWYLNTLLVATICSLVNTVLTLMSAYAFSRLDFAFRKKYMKLLLVIGMFPGFLGMFIAYTMLSWVGLNSGYKGIAGLILISISGSIGGYYISKGFFDTISKSLDEAAMIDGANKNTIFWKVIMPLSKPIIVYTLLMGFTGPWGDYMFYSVIAAGDKEIFNVAVGLQQMLSKGYVQATVYPQFCAAAVCVSVPIMILFFKLQNYYVEGVTGGAVKG